MPRMKTVGFGMEFEFEFGHGHDGQCRCCRVKGRVFSYNGTVMLTLMLHAGTSGAPALCV
jgi:hypothetical protein